VTWSYDLTHPPQLDAAALKTLLGGKGANLAVMSNELGLPVPPGFVITTDACKAYMADGWPSGLDEELRDRMAGVERDVERGFGDRADPLLVSVRSGAPVSMPGMLDTILNLGLNDETTAGLAEVAADTAFAAACRQRLQEMYRAVVGSAQVPEDPWAQLRGAVEAVFRSWDSRRARSYREEEGIREDLGTAVVVQAMVFGNFGADSATGVLFTRNPATGEDSLYGDVLFGAQGEDVVAGTHPTEPVSALDERMPAVAAELRGYAHVLEQHYADVCDIEFTIQQGKLWMLQNRIGKRGAQAALRFAVEMAQDPEFPLTKAQAVRRVAEILADPPLTVSVDRDVDSPVVAIGLPASPGLAVGRIATSPEAAIEMSAQGQSVILVRSETSPDDVHGMAKAAGILTSTGGLASHAAVVARGWDIPAVVGARDVVVDHRRMSIGARIWKQGDQISIDGSSGDVFGEAIESSSTIVPEAETLLRWAKESDIEIGADSGSAPDADMRMDPSAGGGDASKDDVVRALAIKGYVTPDLLAPALRIKPDKAEAVLQDLVSDGAVTESSGMFSLTDEGKAAGTRMLEADRASFGRDAAVAALDGFVALDGRMKIIVTAWQMREVDGKQVLNDHDDAAYDEAVLADLAVLHADASAWIGPLTAGLARLATYAARLDAAAAAAAAGDHPYIASPRVDSYHSIWFELHEDLIRLAGKTREDEVAAGRA
jgi:pyruvate,orthophosphate dikinase